MSSGLSLGLMMLLIGIMPTALLAWVSIDAFKALDEYYAERRKWWEARFGKEEEEDD